jgi:hypothetical protein
LRQLIYDDVLNVVRLSDDRKSDLADSPAVKYTLNLNAMMTSRVSCKKERERERERERGRPPDTFFNPARIPAAAYSRLTFPLKLHARRKWAKCINQAA